MVFNCKSRILSVTIERGQTLQETVYDVQFDHGETATDLERKYIFADFFDNAVTDLATEDVCENTVPLDDAVSGRDFGQGEIHADHTPALRPNGAKDTQHEDCCFDKTSNEEAIQVNPTAIRIGSSSAVPQGPLADAALVLSQTILQVEATAPEIRQSSSSSNSRNEAKTKPLLIVGEHSEV